MNLKPLDDRVVIAQSEAENKTDGGILLPDTAREKPQKTIRPPKSSINRCGSILAAEICTGLRTSMPASIQCST